MDREIVLKLKLITIKDAKPTRKSGYYYFAIPNAFITNELILPDKHYNIYIKELKEKEKRKD